jgi:hypothetical protein
MESELNKLIFKIEEFLDILKRTRNVVNNQLNKKQEKKAEIKINKIIGILNNFKKVIKK